MGYRILSKHFNRDLASSTPKKIAPEQIVSGPQNLKLTNSSWPMYFSKPPEPHLVKEPDGSYRFLHVTSSNSDRHKTTFSEYLQHGRFTPQIDDANKYNPNSFGKWKFAGEDNYSSRHDLIPKMPDDAYITGITPVRLFLPNIRDTQVNLRVTPEIVNAIDPNNLGKFVSRNTNRYLDARSLLFDKTNRLNYEASEWINFLAEKGINYEKSKNPGILGLGIRHDHSTPFIAGYYPQQGYLVTNPHFSNEVKELAARYGLSEHEAIEAFKRHVFLHEIAHVLGIPGDRKGEELQGMLAAEFYSKMSKKFSGTKLEKIYRALAKRNIDYAEYFSASNQFKKSLSKELFSKTKGPLEQIIVKFEAEGIALGYEGDELQSYVEHRVREVYGPLLKDGPSHEESDSDTTRSQKNKSSKFSESANNKSSSKRAGLEKLIERLEQEAEELGVDKGEYVSAQLAKHPIKYVEDKETREDNTEYERSSNTYERRTERESKIEGKAAKSERREKAETSEAVEATAESSASNN